jgi:hypothetical protein
MKANSTLTNLGRTLVLIGLARKIGLRRGGRLIGLAADAYLAQKALRRRAALHRG